tara:strand:+ start:6172 stop:6465 length:294 start_codon:yes stop_codon:yes gene_type:complete
VKLSITINASKIKKQFDLLSKELKQLPKDAHRVFKSATPILTGNARNRTTVNGNTIKANYPYAKRLDQGYSPKAPKGMIAPTLKYIESRINTFTRKR